MEVICKFCISKKNLDEVKNESKFAETVGGRYVVPIKIGIPYMGKKYHNEKASSYSEKGAGDLVNLFEDLRDRPDFNFNFGNFFSICLSSAICLAAIHGKGLVHRDVKLENILYKIELSGHCDAETDELSKLVNDYMELP